MVTPCASTLSRTGATGTPSLLEPSPDMSIVLRSLTNGVELNLLLATRRADEIDVPRSVCSGMRDSAAERVEQSESLELLAREKGVDMPICQAVSAIVEGRWTPSPTERATPLRAGAALKYLL